MSDPAIKVISDPHIPNEYASLVDQEITGWWGDAKRRDEILLYQMNYLVPEKVSRWRRARVWIGQLLIDLGERISG